MSTQEHMKILEMIANGQITAEEGSRLLDASGAAAGAESRPTGTASPGKEPAPKPTLATRSPRWATGPNGSTRRLRVNVVENGGTKVNVNLPLSLMEVGLRIGGRFVDELKDVEDEMQMLLEAIANDVTGKIVEVDDEGTHVEVYIE